VSEKISALAENPRPVGIEKLSGSEEDFYRIRIGDYRVLYTIQDKVLLILIIKVRHRREVYLGNFISGANGNVRLQV
jgi:mRNA interferase RelE/StbE